MVPDSADQANLSEARLEALLKLSRMTDSSTQEVANFALEQGVVLTQSRVGYLAFVNDDETLLTMYSWSAQAMRECAVADWPKVFSLKDTGLWTEALRQRQPVITNDYAAANRAKRGLPKGHVALVRHMSVPVFDGKHIVAIAGVGNKAADYNDSDARQLTLLMEAAWVLLRRNHGEAELRSHRDQLERLVAERTAALTAANEEVRTVNAELQRQLAEKSLTQEALFESEQRLRTICDSALDGVVMIDGDGRVVYWNRAAEQMFGYSAHDFMGQPVHDVLVPPHLRDRAASAFTRFTHSGKGKVVGRVMRLDALRKDGSEFPIEISVSGLYMGQQWWASAIIRDVTQRKRAEKALEEYAVTLEQRGAELSRINVRLAREIAARRRAYRAVKIEQQRLRRMLELNDKERHLIAYEIHDGLTQQLTGAKMQWECFGRLRDADPALAAAAYQTGLELLQQCLEEARRLIGGLRPPILDDYGVLPALRDFFDRIRRGRNIVVDLDTDLDEDHRFGPLLENTVFRIVQEAVNNALHHGKSARVHVSLHQDERALRIEVQDWGIGFSLEDVKHGAFGLEGIRQRARLSGGQAVVQSTVGQGTLVTAELPLTSDKPAELPHAT